jgi:hypothetical protein
VLTPALRLHLSWVVLAAGGLWGIAMAKSTPGGNAVQAALLTGYIAWSLYWGVPPFWRWWRRTGLNAFKFANFLPGGCFLQAAIACTVLFIGGYFFSVFGGGLYYFARQWRASRYQL